MPKRPTIPTLPSGSAITPAPESSPGLSGVVFTPVDLPRDRNPYYVYLGRLSNKNSVETMRYALRAIAGVIAGAEPYEEGGCDIRDERFVNPAAIEWWKLRYQYVERIRAILIEHHKPATVNKILSALRQVLDCSRRLELMSADQCSAAMDIKNVKFDLLPAGRAVAHSDIESLLRSIPRTNSGVRNKAIVATTYFAGLRRSEISWLTMDRVSMHERTLRVLGKGNKERNVMILDDLAVILEEWLSIRGTTDGPLFCSVVEEKPIVEHGLSPQYIYDIIVDAADRSALDYHLSPHDLRRSFITNGIDSGVDPLVMSKIVGHKQVQTTLRYDRREEKVQREQMHNAFDKLRSKP